MIVHSYIKLPEGQENGCSMDWFKAKFTGNIRKPWGFWDLGIPETHEFGTTGRIQGMPVWTTPKWLIDQLEPENDEANIVPSNLAVAAVN